MNTFTIGQEIKHQGDTWKIEVVGNHRQIHDGGPFGTHLFAECLTSKRMTKGGAKVIRNGLWIEDIETGLDAPSPFIQMVIDVASVPKCDGCGCNLQRESSSKGLGEYCICDNCTQG